MNYQKKLFSTTGKCASALVLLLALQSSPTISSGQEPPDNVQGVEVFTRGPVHEAFAGIVTFDPQPGVVVAKAPPELIEELPPDERPEGNDVSWIPGYWAWDDERGDFLWVSGTWRALPPGREWNAGYWAETAQGYQWISGYWSDVAEQETVYLPPPPTTVEAGPNVPAPSVDYGWTPGCWTWREEHYAWRPGYWAQGHSDWDWVPAHYVSTPRGCVFVDGYWDYPVQRRGVIYAPVRFDSAVYAQRDYRYSPSTVISLSVFTEHLFLRPRYNHYYFGDYYEPRYEKAGFHSSYSSYSRGRYYDPIYAQNRWEHRQDREWNDRMEESYRYRRDHASSRPPRSLADQRNMKRDPSDSDFRHRQVATSHRELAKDGDSPMLFQKVKKEERQQLALRGKEVQQSRDQRRMVEASGSGKRGGKPSGDSKPTKVARERSPIAGKPIKELGKGRRPPEAQRAKMQDVKRQPGDPKRGAGAEDRRSSDKKAPAKSQPKKAKEEPKRGSASSDKKAPAKSQPKKAKEEPKRGSASSDKKAPAKSQPKKAKEEPKRGSASSDKKAPAKSQPKKAKEESSGTKKESESKSKKKKKDGKDS